MVQDHWFVGFRSQFVTCTAYAWSQRDGYHTRGLGRLTEYAFSYPEGVDGNIHANGLGFGLSGASQNVHVHVLGLLADRPPHASAAYF